MPGNVGKGRLPSASCVPATTNWQVWGSPWSSSQNVRQVTASQGNWAGPSASPTNNRLGKPANREWVMGSGSHGPARYMAEPKLARMYPTIMVITAGNGGGGPSSVHRSCGGVSLRRGGGTPPSTTRTAVTTWYDPCGNQGHQPVNRQAFVGRR